MQIARSVSIFFLLAFLTHGLTYGQIDLDDMAGDLEEALTFTKYPTYPQYVEMMQLFADSYPEICRLDTFGTTNQGRLLLALKISDKVHENEAEAAFLYTATMHGNELVGYPLMLRLARHLLEGYGNDPEATGLVDSLAIWINPLANPDGTFKGGDHRVDYAIRENDPPGTGAGYDLNRNFPDILKGELDDTTGRPLENRHMMNFLGERLFSLSANIHAGWELVNYPWDYDLVFHPDDAWYQFISREYVDEVHSADPDYMIMENNGITHGASWYDIPGSRQDYMNYHLGGREVTLELSFSKYLDSDSLESFWMKNQRSFLYYMTQATYGIRGRVNSSVSGAPVKAEVSIDGHDNPQSVVYSSADKGDFYRLIKGGTYDVTFSADGYMPRVYTAIQLADYEAVYLYPTLDSLPNSNGTVPHRLDLRIWPNPVADQLHVGFTEVPQQELILTVLSVDGRIMLQHTSPGLDRKAILSTAFLPEGIYLLKVQSGDRTSVYRFIRE